MSALPTRRLLVYVAVGLAVLVVGTVGLVAMRSSSSSSGEELLIDAGGGVQGLAGYNALSAADRSGSAPEAGAATLNSTSTTLAPRIWVQVAGAVRRPGVYELATGARVFEAVAAAGDFTEEADEEAIALAAQLSDGCRVSVPQLGETAAGAVEGPTQSSAGLTGGASASGLSMGVVSLNSATAEELDGLPGIGPALAQQIITYRETQGPFTSIDQLTDVPGIGPAKLEQLRPLVEL
jgi:competence protein ComEA